jgi:S1-C subfamily serine protease
MQPSFRMPSPSAGAIALATLLPACGLTGPRSATPEAAALSFEPYRAARIGAEGLESFLRRRTGIVVCGPAELTAEQCAVWFSGGPLRTVEASTDAKARQETAALAAACAVSPDGYFLTCAHVLAEGPAHVAIEARGAIACAPARTIWSDGERDVALLHAELCPEAWFELAADRSLPEGEPVLTYSPSVGPAAGELEVGVDLPSFDPYLTLALPHDAPLRAGHSGGPAALSNGELLGVQSSTGMDTIFRRRSWLVRVNPVELARRIADDRFAPSPP